MKISTPFNAVGKGLKAVGRVASYPFRWAGRQIEKEMRMDEEKDNKARAAGKALNAEYSGKPTFKYGYNPKKN